MPAIDKTSNLYASFERICPMLKKTGSNLNAKAVATAAMESVINDINDALLVAKLDASSIDWIMADEQKAVRIKIRDNIKFLFTAPKNAQNSYLEPSGLMPKAVGEHNTDEFA
jgi:hypothetical protein